MINGKGANIVREDLLAVWKCTELLPRVEH